MTTIAERRRRTAERNRIERERAVADAPQPVGVIAQLEALSNAAANQFRQSPPPLLERMFEAGHINGEQLSAGQWYRSLFEKYATHYPAVTASYNPSGAGYDNDDADELSPVNRRIGMLSGVLIGCCVFDEASDAELIRMALNKARIVQVSDW